MIAAAAAAVTLQNQVGVATRRVAMYEKKKLTRCGGGQGDVRGRCARFSSLRAARRWTQERRNSSCRGDSCRMLATYCSVSSSSFPQPQFMPPSSLPQHDVDVQGLRVAIEVKGDAFSGRRQSRHILNGIDLKVPRGRMHMILGLNGSGKVRIACLYFET